MPTENRSCNTEIASELLPCPFCGQQDFLIERLDSDASVVICQGLTGPHEACLARGPVGVAQDEGEEQPGRDKAVELWNARAEQHQGEPYGWAHDDGKEFTTHADYASDLQKEGIEMTPLYTRADPGEVERLRAKIQSLRETLPNSTTELVDLRTQLTERDALLAEALLAIEGGCSAVSLPDRINAALSDDDEQDPPSGYFFDTGPYQVELGEKQWLKALAVFDNYTQGNQNTFSCPGDNLRGLVSELLIELGLAPAVD